MIQSNKQAYSFNIVISLGLNSFMIPHAIAWTKWIRTHPINKSPIFWSRAKSEVEAALRLNLSKSENKSGAIVQ